MVAPTTQACESDCDCHIDSDSESETSSTGSSEVSVNDALLAVTSPSPHDIERQSAIDHIVFVEDLDGLRKLSDVEVQLGVWRREKVPGFVTKLSDPSFDKADLPAFQGVVSPDICLKVMKNYLCTPYKDRPKIGNGLSEECMDDMANEIDQLVRAFSEVSGADLINVKLQVSSGNGCRYWHQDSVPMRMVVTYRGPCTEFVPPMHTKTTLRRRKRNSKFAQSLSHHDVALFKGKGESSEQLLGHDGIVHRSPRIDGEGIDRLVLVLDVGVEGWHY